MVDLTSIEPWLEKGSLNSIAYAVSTISRIGFEEWFNGQLETFCNCTKTFKDGRRCTQTNDIRYAKELLTTVKLIEAYAEDKKDECYIKLLERHKANLEFEAINGFEYDLNPKNKKKQISTTTKKQVKQTSTDSDNKPKKETAAERKLKAHAIKISALTFKPKAIKNENTI